MDYQITEKPAFRVVGRAERVSTKDGENFREIPRFWGDCIRDGSVKVLSAIGANGAVTGNSVLGICTDFSADMEAFTYMIAAESAADDVPEAMVEMPIPAATWAVFESIGAMPEAIQNVWGGIFSEFFPTTDYKHGPGPDLEVYPDGDPTRADYRSEVWVPVVKK